MAVDSRCHDQHCFALMEGRRADAQILPRDIARQPSSELSASTIFFSEWWWAMTVR